MSIKIRIGKNKARLLQDCLDEIASGAPLERILERYPEHAAWLDEQIQGAGWLAQRQRLVSPRPEFLVESQLRLLQRLEANLTPAARLRRVFTSRFIYARLAVQAALLLLLGLVLFNVIDRGVLLAKRALPGDLVYPLKQTSERIRLAISIGPERDARLHLIYTRQRSLELQELLLEGKYESATLAASLFYDQFQQTVQALTRVSQRNPLLAQEMQLQMSASLQEQSVVLRLLVEGLPRSLRSGVEQVMLATSQ
jgi:hypothetical protein